MSTETLYFIEPKNLETKERLEKFFSFDGLWGGFWRENLRFDDGYRHDVWQVPYRAFVKYMHSDLKQDESLHVITWKQEYREPVRREPPIKPRRRHGRRRPSRAQRRRLATNQPKPEFSW